MNQFRTTAAILLALAASTPAFSADRPDVASVSYGDLDLSKSAGVTALRHRLIVASRSVCGDSDLRQPGTAASMQSCREATLQQAFRDLRQAVAHAADHRGTALALAN